MIFTMATGGSFIQMEIITLGIGLTERGLVMDGLLTNLVGSMKVNGSTVSSWENDLMLIKYRINDTHKS